MPLEKIEENGISKSALDRQFARTPDAVGFRAGGETFVLVTLRFIYGDRPDSRFPELKAIAEWMADWATETSEWEQNRLGRVDSWDSQISRGVIQGCFLGGGFGRHGSTGLER